MKCSVEIRVFCPPAKQASCQRGAGVFVIHRTFFKHVSGSSSVVIKHRHSARRSPLCSSATENYVKHPRSLTTRNEGKRKKKKERKQNSATLWKDINFDWFPVWIYVQEYFVLGRQMMSELIHRVSASQRDGIPNVSNVTGDNEGDWCRHNGRQVE